MRSAPRRRLLPLLLVAAALAPRAARADDLAVPRFDPAFAGDRFLWVPSADVKGDLVFHAALFSDYAKNPLVYRRNIDGAELSEIVGDQLLLHLDGTFALWNRLALNLDVPMAVLQSGSDATSPSGPDFGDLRVGLRGRIWGERKDPVQFGVGLRLWLPTGTGAFVTDGTARALPELLASGRLERVAHFAISLGAEIRGKKDYLDAPSGTALTGGVAVGFLFGSERQLQIGPELSFSQLLIAGGPHSLAAELGASARYRFFRNFEVGGGASLGLSDALGTPLYRVVGMISYSPRLDPGLDDDDKDHITNDRDACPDYPGQTNPDPDKNGCPAAPAPILRDSDGDDVPDGDDACPFLPGVPQGDPAVNGCPVDATEENALLSRLQKQDPSRAGDTDGDKILDKDDACPEEKGAASEVAAKNGCPELVRIAGDEIVLLHEIQFDTNRATLRRTAVEMLEELADVLRQHPEIELVEIAGHTDSIGTLGRNDGLAEQRAKAVAALLEERSIGASRLTAKGYGASQPVAPNTTSTGRQRNRRVQFRILKRTAPNAPSTGAAAATPQEK